MAETAGTCRAEQKKDQARIENMQIDTEKLINAVFYRQSKNKNIFNIMSDDITEMKAQMLQHEKAN